MAIKVGLENNILKIDDGVKILDHTAVWCDMDFTDNSVIIRNMGIGDINEHRTYTNILFTEFQDLASTPYATEKLVEKKKLVFSEISVIMYI